MRYCIYTPAISFKFNVIYFTISKQILTTGIKTVFSTVPSVSVILYVGGNRNTRRNPNSLIWRPLHLLTYFTM